MGEAKILLFPLLKNKSHHFWLQERVSVKLNMDNKYKALEEHPPSYNESVGQPSTLPLPTYPLPSANPPVVVTDIPNPGMTPVVGQPQIIYVQAPVIPEEEAPDHLVMAILVTVCCCLPLGREAKKFALIGLACGIAIIVGTLALYGVVIGITI